MINLVCKGAPPLFDIVVAYDVLAAVHKHDDCAVEIGVAFPPITRVVRKRWRRTEASPNPNTHGSMQ
jgi:hypothetical protein